MVEENHTHNESKVQQQVGIVPPYPLLCLDSHICRTSPPRRGPLVLRIVVSLPTPGHSRWGWRRWGRVVARWWRWAHTASSYSPIHTAGCLILPVIIIGPKSSSSHAHPGLPHPRLPSSGRTWCSEGPPIRHLVPFFLSLLSGAVLKWIVQCRIHRSLFARTVCVLYVCVCVWWCRAAYVYIPVMC